MKELLDLIVQDAVTTAPVPSAPDALAQAIETNPLEFASFADGENVIRNATLLRTGMSKTRYMFSADVVRRDGPAVFSGVPGFYGHSYDMADRTDPRNLAFVIENATFDEASQALKGDIHFFADAAGQIAKAREAFESGRKDLLGLSIMTSGKSVAAKDAAGPYYNVEALTRTLATSVDFVIFPAAGGSFFESAFGHHTEEHPMWKTLTLAKLKTLAPKLYEAIMEALKGKDVSALEELEFAQMESSHSDVYAAIAKFAEQIGQSMSAAAPTGPTAQTPNPPTQSTEPPAPQTATPPNPAPQASMTPEQIEQLVAARLAKTQQIVTLHATVAASNLPAEYATRIDTMIDQAAASGEPPTAQVVASEIEFYKKIADAAHLAQSGQRIVVVAEPTDRLAMAMDGLFGVSEGTPSTRPFSGIREAYIAYTGDYELRGEFRITQSTMRAQDLVYALGTSMNRRLVKMYSERDYGWRKFCAVTETNNFKLQERNNIGYYSDLSLIEPENENYNEKEILVEERSTFTLAQRGDLVGVTRKMILNDDLGVLLQIVDKLGRSAARTLAKLIYVTMIQSNAVWTGDGLAFFYDRSTASVACGNNKVTTALNEANLTAAAGPIALLQGMKEPGSLEKIGWDVGPGDTVLIVPTALQWVARELNQARPTAADGYNPLFNFWGANDEDIVVCPLLSSSVDYWIGLKPDQCEWIEVSFMSGHQNPEFFLADNPLVGEMFMCDKMLWKARHEYQAFFKDPRGAVYADVT